MCKEEREFFDVSAVDWQAVEGGPDGAYEKILSRDSETGSYTRVLRFDPGVETVETLSHDFWEEVYILRGGLIDRGKGETFVEGMYACRPPGMKHGPYDCPVGCVTLEIRYYR